MFPCGLSSSVNSVDDLTLLTLTFYRCVLALVSDTFAVLACFWTLITFGLHGRQSACEDGVLTYVQVDEFPVLSVITLSVIDSWNGIMYSGIIYDIIALLTVSVHY